MDFNGQFSFAGAQSYQQFVIPPLTPSHSHSAASDDFNTSPPQDGFDALSQSHNDHFYDYAHTFGAHQPEPAFPSPPTPPNHPAYGVSQHQQQQQHQQHHVLHQQPRLGNGGVPHGVASVHGADMTGVAKLEPGSDDAAQARGGSDDDENLTPAQSRRKAQNRAAQRAFRERKEKHVKDLEAKLANLTAAQQEASTENERLKRDLQKMSTENEILRATSNMSAGPPPAGMHYSPTDFYSTVLQNHANKTLSHRVVTTDDGERLLAVAATWDMIVNHEAFKLGLIDIGDISERLKNCARCDGQGPVFSEHTIQAAIEQSMNSASDDLL